MKPTLTPACGACTRPVADTGIICHDCTDASRTKLAQIAADIGELAPVIARQTRHGTGTGRPSAETPLPIDVHAADTGRHVRAVLASWTMLIHEQRGGRLPADATAALARHLAGQWDWLRHRDYAPDALAEIDALARRLRNAVDSPAASTYLGPCAAITGTGQCEADLRAIVGAKVTTCRACGTCHDVARRRETNIATCRDLLIPRTTVIDVLDRWGYPVPEGTVDTWIHRRRLVPRGGRYRVGDALDLAVAWAGRRTRTT